MVSSAVEHYLDMVGVTGSIPVPPTIFSNISAAYRLAFPRFRGVLPTVAKTDGDEFCCCSPNGSSMYALL